MPNQHAETQHAVVWIDHRQAKIFFLTRDAADEMKLGSAKHFDQAHKHAGTVDGSRTPIDEKFLHSIIEALKPAHEWLFIGPGSAKDELAKHAKHHDHTFVARLKGVEASHHPTDGQIVAFARKYFRATDRMLG